MSLADEQDAVDVHAKHQLPSDDDETSDDSEGQAGFPRPRSLNKKRKKDAEGSGGNGRSSGADSSDSNEDGRSKQKKEKKAGFTSLQALMRMRAHESLLKDVEDQVRDDDGSPSIAKTMRVVKRLKKHRHTQELFVDLEDSTSIRVDASGETYTLKRVAGAGGGDDAAGAEESLVGTMMRRVPTPTAAYMKRARKRIRVKATYFNDQYAASLLRLGETEHTLEKHVIAAKNLARYCHNHVALIKTAGVTDVFVKQRGGKYALVPLAEFAKRWEDVTVVSVNWSAWQCAIDNGAPMAFSDVVACMTLGKAICTNPFLATFSGVEQAPLKADAAVAALHGLGPVPALDEVLAEQKERREAAEKQADQRDGGAKTMVEEDDNTDNNDDDLEMLDAFGDSDNDDCEQKSDAEGDEEESESEEDVERDQFGNDVRLWCPVKKVEAPPVLKVCAPPFALQYDAVAALYSPTSPLCVVPALPALYHIKNVLHSGMQEQFVCTIGTEAHTVQKPDVKSPHHTVYACNLKRQVGKGFHDVFILRIVGNRYAITAGDLVKTVLDTFNDAIENKQMIIFDETSLENMKQHLIEALRNFLTEAAAMLRRKNKSQEYVDNCISVRINTNNSRRPLLVAEFDGRLMVADIFEMCLRSMSEADRDKLYDAYGWARDADHQRGTQHYAMFLYRFDAVANKYSTGGRVPHTAKEMMLKDGQASDAQEYFRACAFECTLLGGGAGNRFRMPLFQADGGNKWRIPDADKQEGSLNTKWGSTTLVVTEGVVQDRARAWFMERHGIDGSADAIRTEKGNDMLRAFEKDMASVMRALREANVIEKDTNRSRFNNSARGVAFGSPKEFAAKLLDSGWTLAMVRPDALEVQNDVKQWKTDLDALDAAFEAACKSQAGGGAPPEAGGQPLFRCNIENLRRKLDIFTGEGAPANNQAAHAPGPVDAAAVRQRLSQSRREPRVYDQDVRKRYDDLNARLTAFENNYKPVLGHRDAEAMRQDAAIAAARDTGGDGGAAGAHADGSDVIERVAASRESLKFATEPWRTVQEFYGMMRGGEDPRFASRPDVKQQRVMDKFYVARVSGPDAARPRTLQAAVLASLRANGRKGRELNDVRQALQYGDDAVGENLLEFPDERVMRGTHALDTEFPGDLPYLINNVLQADELSLVRRVAWATKAPVVVMVAPGPDFVYVAPNLDAWQAEEREELAFAESTTAWLSIAQLQRDNLVLNKRYMRPFTDACFFKRCTWLLLDVSGGVRRWQPLRRTRKTPQPYKMLKK